MALIIQDIERARANFYAPAFEIMAAGADVVRTLHLEITSVRVETMLEGADRFSFVINNGFDISKREFLRVGGRTLPEFFEFGAPVEIRMGYGDRSALELMLTGIVTELSTSFPSSGLPELTVSGYDHSYRLMKGSESQNWEKRKDSDVAREIAGLYNLTPSIEDTSAVHPKIEKSQESAAQFLTRLAARNGFEFFVVNKELVFRSPANDEKGAIELVWGRGLMSFAPEINLSEQVTNVEVYGWNVQTKKPIIGRARQGDEPGRDKTRASGKPRASGAEALQRVCKKDEGTLRVREPVFSQQQADQMARAILKRRAEGFVGGHGESIGIPEIRPNANVTLKGLGDLFSTTFYVHQATHTVDTSGYRTSFDVKDTTI
jgi:Bacteriophage probable baseplate hub protein